MTRVTLLVLFTLVMSACGQKQESTVPSVDLAVRCGVLIDGLTEQPRDSQLVLVSDGRISEIVSDEGGDIDAFEVMDLREYTCLPGLIDTHVHLDGLPEDADDYTIYLRRTPEQTARLSEELAAIVLRAGFTTVRHVGAYKAWVDRDLREQIESGAVIGPRIRVGGPYLTIPHGGGDMYIPGVNDADIPEYYRKGVARGPDAFRRRAQEVVAGGADFLKVIASGAVFGHGSDPGAPEMTREELIAVVEIADAAGIKVTAHAHSAESIKDAILAGVSSIEHASLGDDESVQLAVEHNVAFSMDVYNGTYTEEVGKRDGYAQEFMDKNWQTTEAQRIVFEKALAAGVTILFGTDLGVLPHHLGARQFSVMVERGMTPMQAIQSATSAPATHMGIDTDVGALEAGRFADLVAVRGNPLDDISVLQEIDVVLKAGELIE